MLSNQQNQQPTSRPVAARRIIKHARQRSTPVASMLNIEPATGYFPDQTQQNTPGYRRQTRQGQIGHRRGLSLDPSMRLQDLRLANTRSPLGIINNTTGMVNTNQGPLYQQHKMRETQMPGMTRPGQFESQQGLGNIMEDPNMSNQTQADVAPLSSTSDSFPSYFTSMMVSPGHQSPERSQSRPYTPTNMSLIAAPNPYTSMHHSQDLQFTQSSPIRHGSIDLGLQAIPQQNIMARGGSFQGHIAMKRSQSQNSAPATNNNGFRNSVIYAPMPMQPLDLTNMSAYDFGFQGYETGYESSAYSPTQTSPAGSSMRATPDLPATALFGELVGGAPRLAASDNGSVPPSPTKSRSQSPRKKAAPLPEEMIIEDTGITTEQVDAFIQGPDPQTNKFTCLFDGCTMKPIGRKENIRAHVQTHLGDRKYVCTVCDSRFVRPNDLKRHAIIHQDVKEFVCKCGAAFGRQDALRRHRIRKPFCVDGDPTLELMRKEEKKRGRPRKIAPTETTERRERKENIRKQVMERKRKGSLPRSVAGTSKSDRSCSPEHVQQHGSVSAYSPTNKSLTPPMSPHVRGHRRGYSEIEATVARLSISPQPTHGTIPETIDQQFGVGHESPFGEDHFEQVSSYGPATPPGSSPYGTPPELELASSPAASKFTMDFSDAEFTQSTTTSVHDFGTLTATANFSDEFLSESVLMDQILKECGAGTGHDGVKTENMEDLERYLMLDQM